MSIVRRFVRYALAIAVVCVCALLAPAMSVIVVGAVEQPLVEAKQALKTMSFVRGQVSGTGDIVPSQNPVAGTQIPSGNAVNVTQPDPEDPGGSGDSSQPEIPRQSGDGNGGQGIDGVSQPEPSSPPGDGSGTSDGVDGETPIQPEISRPPETSRPPEDGRGTSDEVSPVVVPNLVGLSESEAEQALYEENLLLGEVSGEGDKVISQSPIAGTMVSPESDVDIDMGPIYVIVPNLVGSTVQEAKQRLYPDLVLNEVSGEGDEVPGKCDVIDSQDPVAEEEALRGSTVDVYLKSTSVPVPNLVGRTVREARVLLTAAGLVLDNDPASDSRVESQKPAAETLACPGSAVTVTVSEVPAPPAPPVGPPTPPVAQPPVAQPPVAQPPAAQPPVAQPPLAQAPAAQPPVTQPPAARPEVPPAEPPVAPVAILGPRLWPVVLTLVLLTLLFAGLLVSRAIRALQEQKGIHTDIRVVAGADLGIDVEVMQSPSDHSPSTCVVRIEPHADSGTQVLEEVHQ